MTLIAFIRWTLLHRTGAVAVYSLCNAFALDRACPALIGSLCPLADHVGSELVAPLCSNDNTGMA